MEELNTDLDEDVLEQKELVSGLDTSQDPQYQIDEEETYETFTIQQDLERYRQIQLTETTTYASD